MECKDKVLINICEWGFDLIVTLWNVKTVDPSEILIGQSRFNSYIMECKGDRISYVLYEKIDLIVTLWNVKRITRSGKMLKNMI